MSLSKLHSAAEAGDLVLVKRLVVEGHDLQERAPYGWPGWGGTPLHFAVRGGHLTVVQYLVDDKHCDPNVKDDIKRTPLHFACRGGHLTVVQYLVVEKNCNPNYNDNWKKTPLHYACEGGHLTVVQYLVDERNCNPNCNDDGKMTPLHYACQGGHLTVVQYLVDDKHCDPNVKDDFKRTPLHFACEGGHLTVVQYLVDERNCNPNCNDKWKTTPLHYACQYGHLAVVQCLVDKKHCDLNVRSLFNRTPLYLAYECGHTDICKCLVEHGANLEILYTGTLDSRLPACPGQAATKMFMVGHPEAGKSTLTKALCRGSRYLLSRFANHFVKVSDVEQQTAGIIPHLVNSKEFGLTIIYDFAGHEEFYASHDAVIHSTMADSPGVFLVLASLSRKAKEFSHSITYWLSLVENQAATLGTNPHVLILGTHSDQISKQEKALRRTIVSSLQTNATFSNLLINGYIEIDCRYPESTSISELRTSLAASFETLRCSAPSDFNYHILYIFLLDRFTGLQGVQLNSVVARLVHESKDEYRKLAKDISELDTICNSLSRHGRILYLRCEESIDQGWIIIDQHALLARVNGTIFAPIGFTEHQALVSSTGVVPCSKLSAQFHDLDPAMLTQFLTRFEFCCQLSDSDTLQLLSQSERESNDSFFFFPTLVQGDTPKKIWEPSDRFAYNSGWLLQCSQPQQFLTPRFHQILLVRLSLELDSAEHGPNVSDHPAIHRRCKVWKNGLYWPLGSGVEGLVEVTSKQVTVLIRSLRDCEMAAVKLRSAIIRKVLVAQAKFCASVTPTEYLVQQADATQFPLKPPSDMDLVSIAAVAKAVVRGEPCVVSIRGSPLKIEELLLFEPYAHLGEDNLRDLFDDSTHKPIDTLLGNISDVVRVHNQVEKFVELFGFSPSQLEEHVSRRAGPVLNLKLVFDVWKCQGSATRQHLRNQLDKWSVFTGRNPLIVHSSSNSGSIRPRSECAPFLTLPAPPLFDVTSSSDADVQLHDETTDDEQTQSRLRPDAVPTLPELFDFPGCTRKINIVQEIGIEWLTFGTLLLDDTMGTIVPEVKESCQGNIYNTNAEILGRWIRKADVSDCSWHNLIVTLRKSHRETLAQDIADRVGDDS